MKKDIKKDDKTRQQDAERAHQGAARWAKTPKIMDRPMQFFLHRACTFYTHGMQ